MTILNDVLKRTHIYLSKLLDPILNVERTLYPLMTTVNSMSRKTPDDLFFLDFNFEVHMNLIPELLSSNEMGLDVYECAFLVSPFASVAFL